MTPVFGSMPSPGGRPLSVQVSGESLASAPDMGKETAAPSVPDWSLTAATETGSPTHQRKTWLALAPLASAAVTVTTKTPAAASPNAIVPVMRPLAASMPRPGGRPVSLYVSAVPLQSLACTCSDTVSPSVPDWSLTSATATGLPGAKT